MCVRKPTWKDVCNFISLPYRVLIIPVICSIQRWIRDSCQNKIQQVARLCARCTHCYTSVNQADYDEESAEANYQERIYLEAENRKLTEENRRLKQEKDSILHRLSELMSLKLRDGNPNIVDLSDEYRPSKLAELSSELYDNEWTSAYESLETNTGLGETSEKQCIQFLLDVLLETFEFCQTVCEQEWGQLVSEKWEGNAVIKTEEQKMLKDVRKEEAKDRLPDIEKKCLGQLELCFQSHNSCFKDISILDYMKGCVKLCWFMQFQDPPVVFVCPGWKSSQILSTCSPVSFSQNHKLQPLIVLGEREKENQSYQRPENTVDLVGDYERTSEGSKMPDEVEDECGIVMIPLQANESSVSQEIRDYRKDKEEKASDMSKEKRMVFDRCLFKEFTKRGHFVDFIVWPIMYLHERGPILSKGVAQGCN